MPRGSPYRGVDKIRQLPPAGAALALILFQISRAEGGTADPVHEIYLPPIRLAERDL